MNTVSVKREDIKTLGDLRTSSYKVESVKDELRRNLLKRLHDGSEVFPGILGYDRSVIPQLQNAILSRHDILLLGLRGQAKSRILRLIPLLLDEYIPVVAGSELNDNPFSPLSKFACDRIASEGEETPIAWLHRSERYAEKLATPDTSIADLIGDIDPIKAAHRRLTYADEEVIHFGIIPRTNRGIFAINELPDLQARIQVGLLNIMEEQDIQIRGFNVRFPLDLMMLFSANPEDYTNRGNIITPLKDRIDCQVLTHYPKDLSTALAITDQEAWQNRGGVRVTIPEFIRQVIEVAAFEARASEYVDQKSGVSARMTRSALEAVIANAERRAALYGQSQICVRVSDLYYVESAITGKLELVYEGEQEGPQKVARLLIGRAIRRVFADYFPDPSLKGRETYGKILEWFAQGNTLTLDPELSDASFKKCLRAVSGLDEVITSQFGPAKKQRISAKERWILREFVLEGLHQASMLGKEEQTYSDMMGSMLGSLDPSEEEEDFG
ncbi:MAG: magnesium chelatase [Bacteroidota bacterium]|nr:magnesium chelatase [Bacteroidota bacterium]MXZ16681.1 magnesium chelatase [Rhodothermaceae bacterium]MYG70404.1 magnesium chelatase [Rhodothermaceae bacterium]MYJ45775.1 magnesium chelatase [Rhodothermaceae bacterium]